MFLIVVLVGVRCFVTTCFIYSRDGIWLQISDKKKGPLRKWASWEKL